jgi:hypothetical protein
MFWGIKNAVSSGKGISNASIKLGWEYDDGISR